MITAIVLAAGKSSRMGSKNKMFLPFKATTIISSVIAELIISDVDEIIVVTDSEEHFPELAIVRKVRACVNPDADQGLTSSIQTGIKFADHNSDYLICLGDMPLINSADYNLLINSYLKNNQKAIIQPYKDGVTGNPVLFSNHFRSEIIESEQPNGCKPVVLANQEYVHKVPVSSEAYFTDIDTMDQYNKLTNTGRSQ